MTINTIFAIIILVIGILFAGVALYVYLRNKTFEEIRCDVYQLFLQAEHKYKESGAGKQKMEWVVYQARMLLAEWLQMFITEDFLFDVFQKWFDAVKDLLDDGKINNSEGDL
jgi:hypothetical protein